MRTTAEPDERLHYREALSALFRVDEPKAQPAPAAAAAVINEAEQRDIDNQGRARHFGDLKQALYEEGFNLKPYNKANASNFYYMKFVYSNKLMRDTMLLTYLVEYRRMYRDCGCRIATSRPSVYRLGDKPNQANKSAV